MLSLAGDINEQKKDKNVVTAQTIGEMLAAEKCLQSSLEVRGVGDGKDKKSSALWMLFSLQKNRSQSSCILHLHGDQPAHMPHHR